MYCQSKDIERRPRPSFPFEPPNTRVKSAEFGLAKQNTEKPVRRGKIHSGTISQINMLSERQHEVDGSKTLIRQLTLKRQ